MGNANGREDGSIGTGDPSVRSAAEAGLRGNYAPNSQPPIRPVSSDSMANSPPQSPRRSTSPVLQCINDFNPFHDPLHQPGDSVEVLDDGEIVSFADSMVFMKISMILMPFMIRSLIP